MVVGLVAGGWKGVCGEKPSGAGGYRRAFGAGIKGMKRRSIQLMLAAARSTFVSEHSIGESFFEHSTNLGCRFLWHGNFATRRGNHVQQRLLTYRAMWRFGLCGEPSSLNHTRYLKLKLHIKLSMKAYILIFLKLH